MSLTTRVLIALIAGLAAGLAISVAGSPGLVRVAGWIEPLGTLFINAIRMTVIPLVVGSLVAGIASAPDPRILGRVGVRALLLFLVTLAGGALVTSIAAPPLFAMLHIDPAASASLRASAAASGASMVESARNIPGAAAWVIALVPPNPVKAAADGAMLPLIVFAVLFGLAIAALTGEARQTVVRLFEGIRDASLVLVEWVLATAPVGVFALALPLAARLGLSAAGALAGYIATVSIFSTVFAVVVLYPLASTFGRIPLFEFARAVLPAQAVALSSRSSMASLPALIESARVTLRLPDEIPGFLLPLAASVYRVGASIGLPIGVIFIARLYGVDLSVAQLASVAVTSVLISFSIPGIPGGSIIIMAPVLMSAGLPVEGIGILLGVDTIPDMFRTAANVTGDMAIGVAIGGRRRASIIADRPATR